MSDHGEIWHYTTAEGLISILSSNVLRAGAASFMNDQAEIRTGSDLWETRLSDRLASLEGDGKRIADVFSQALKPRNPHSTFVACACRDGDNLTMWRNYTGEEVGFAISFAPSRPLTLRRQRQLESVLYEADVAEIAGSTTIGIAEAKAALVAMHRNFENSPLTWNSVIYDPEDQEDRIDDLLDDIEDFAENRHSISDDEEVILFVNELVDAAEMLATFKNPAFEDERESRVICAIPTQHLRRCYTKYRSGRYGVIPFVELGLPEIISGEYGDAPWSMSRLPIDRVTVGPTPYPEAARAGVKDLLETYGYVHVEIVLSGIPFRR